MTLGYEYYGKYDDNAGDKINLEVHIRDWLQEMELMLDYIEINLPEILVPFTKQVVSRYKVELDGKSFVLSDVGLDRLENDQSLLSNYSHLKDLALAMIMRYIPFKGYSLSSEEVYIRWLDFLRPKYRLRYHRITVLVDIMGREPGIKFFKDFVEFWGEEIAKKLKGTHSYEHVRENRVKTWKEGNAMEFAIVDVSEAAFLGKFDKCISHESMKHVEDQELAYYSVCYPAPRLLEYAHENISMRRTQTLFTADFCDELRWDRNVHDEPEQPSLEFSRKLVPK